MIWRSCTCVHEVFAQSLFGVFIYFLGLLKMYLAVSQFLSFSVSIPIFAGEVDVFVLVFLLLAKLLSFLVGYSDSICRYLMVDQCFSRCFRWFSHEIQPRVRIRKGTVQGHSIFFFKHFGDKEGEGASFFLSFLIWALESKFSCSGSTDSEFLLYPMIPMIYKWLYAFVGDLYIYIMLYLDMSNSFQCPLCY